MFVFSYDIWIFQFIYLHTYKKFFVLYMSVWKYYYYLTIQFFYIISFVIQVIHKIINLIMDAFAYLYESIYLNPFVIICIWISFFQKKKLYLMVECLFEHKRFLDEMYDSVWFFEIQRIKRIINKFNKKFQEKTNTKL